MKAEELAFVNQQLAEMLCSGIPLEGALRQLCADMQRGELRHELELLVADLANGIPLPQALAARKLPAFYVQMLNVGVASNDLPGVLTLVADYYERANSIWTRLNGLMVYAFILLGGLVGAMSVMAFMLGVARNAFRDIYGDLLGGGGLPPLTRIYIAYGAIPLCIPVILAVGAFLTAVVILVVPTLRQRYRWQLPALHETSLWQCASAMHMMMQGGCTLNQAVGLMRQLEQGTPAGDDLVRWQERLKGGSTKFQEIAAGSRSFPPLFVWIVGNAREEIGDGFRQAAEIYLRRASHRVEALLYAALPATVIVLGLVIVVQVALFVIAAFLPLINLGGCL